MVEQGFSSANPALARGYQGVIINGRRVSSGSSRRSRKPPSPTVKVSGDTVFINGQGFSVAPELQESFIRSRASGSSAQSAINQVQKNLEAERKRQEELRRIALEKKRQAELNKRILALNEIINKEEGYRKVVAEAERRRIENALQSTKEGLTSNAGIDELIESQGGIKGQKYPFKVLRKKSLLENDTINVNRAKSNVEKELIENRRLAREGTTAAIRAGNQAKRLVNSGLSNLLGYGVISNNVLRSVKELATSTAAQKKFLNAVNTELNPKKIVRSIPNIAIISREAPIVAKRLQQTYIASANKLSNYIVNNPGEAVIVIGTDILIFEGIAKTLSKIGQFANRSKTLSNFFKRFTIKRGRLIDNYGKIEGIRVAGQVSLKPTPSVISNLSKSGTSLNVINRRIDEYVNKIINKIERDSKTKFSPYIRDYLKGRLRIMTEAELRKRGLDINTLKLLQKRKGGVGLIKKVSSTKKKISTSIKSVTKKFNIKRRAYKITSNYKKAITNAVKIQDLALKKGKRIPLYNPAYDKAIQYIVELADAIAQVRGVRYIQAQARAGFKISVDEANKLLREFRDEVYAELSKKQRFKDLVQAAEANRTDALIILRNGFSPRKYFSLLYKTVSTYIKSSKPVKVLNQLFNKIKRKVKGKIKKISKKRKIAKNKRLTKKQKAASLERARKVRKNSKTVTVFDGTDVFQRIDDKITQFAELYGKKRGRLQVERLKQNGVVLDKYKEGQIIKRVERLAEETLKNLPDYKLLKRLEKRFGISQRSVKKIGSQIDLRKDILNLRRRLNKRLKSSKVVNYLDRKIGKKVRSLRSLPKKIKSNIATRKKLKQARAAFKRTNKYRLLQKKTFKEVTLNKLLDIVTKQKQKKVIRNTFQRFFQEIEKKRLIPVDATKWKQLKNSFIKRAEKALIKRDRAELQKLSRTLREMVADVNKKSKLPDVNIKLQNPKTNVDRGIKTIKNFEADVGKGEFVEVKQGDKVLLQRTKQVTKQATKQGAKQRTTAKVVKVIKKPINFAPLYRYIAYSILKQVAASGAKKPIAQVQSRSLLPKVRSISGVAQDVKVLQAFVPASKQESLFRSSAVDSATKQAYDLLFRTPSRTKTKTKQIKEQAKKKKLPLLKLPKKKVSKKKRGGEVAQFDVYAKPIKTVSGKKAKRYIKINDAPLTRTDAMNLRNYVLDTSLSRTGYIKETKPSKKVSRLAIQKGYARKTMNKFRQQRIVKKKGKRLPEGKVIEKTKHILDTRGEKKQLSLRKRIKTLQKKKRIITPTQRKKMLANLKKARLAKKRKERRRKK